MKSDDTHLFIVHGVVRAILLDRPVKDAYLAIFKSVFPGAVLGRFGCLSRRTAPLHLQRVCDSLYRIDNVGTACASCYSATIVAQLLAFASSLPSEMVVGVKKQDGKIVGHAWLELGMGMTVPAIVNPGQVDLAEYRPMSRMAPERAIAAWAATL
ncbi:lasso peptide biosynthesis protein [Chitinasiproducens palmae]|uniref:Transglutaminase-like superfamily protein n=1 Tax=Chitinasiproducens palmae TaxID=1770053 RepID=A0A1H2PLP2_9BURK|nr:lasso peptide biosynthesis protein [Chitinasiproducens palmae]SDV47381.1 Transglutaminase-like superfamily protein [Chitinasiproducens palmae]